jgi:hypothetical protein
MTEYDNNNQAALWKNDKRETDKHPHLKGSATIDNVEYWVSAWTNKAEGNQPIIRLKLEPKEAQAKPAQKVDDDFLEDIPF